MPLGSPVKCTGHCAPQSRDILRARSSHRSAYPLKELTPRIKPMLEKRKRSTAPQGGERNMREHHGTQPAVPLAQVRGQAIGLLMPVSGLRACRGHRFLETRAGFSTGAPLFYFRWCTAFLLLQDQEAIALRPDGRQRSGTPVVFCYHRGNARREVSVWIFFYLLLSRSSSCGERLSRFGRCYAYFQNDPVRPLTCLPMPKAQTFIFLESHATARQTLEHCEE